MRKKLIEVALPLEAINRESAREKSIRHGHPSTLHLWWARRPLAACRAVLFASLVDDPSSHPEQFPTEEAQERERQRLFRIVEELVKWENSNNELVLEQARAEIRKACKPPVPPNTNDIGVIFEEALQFNGYEEFKDVGALANKRLEDYRETGIWRGTLRELRGCLFFEQRRWRHFGETPTGQDHEAIRMLYHTIRSRWDEVEPKLPPVLDPFCGGGSIPLEAQRLGLEAYAGDLNPVAVLITKALIEIPPKFANRPPVHPVRDKRLLDTEWRGARGLAEDVRYYGQWMRDEAERRIGHLYPKVTLPPEYGGGEATVIAWLWARTVKCPNPACGAQMPLMRSFWLSTKGGKKAWVQPVIDRLTKTIRFDVKTGEGMPVEGTVKNRSAVCLICEAISTLPYIRAEAQVGRMGSIPLVIVAEGQRRRIYVPFNAEHEKIAHSAQPKWKPDEKVTFPSHDVDRLPMYGMYTWGDAFTPRQLVALTTFSNLVSEAKDRGITDAMAAGLADDAVPLNTGGKGATAYADAVATYLGLVMSKTTMFLNVLARWRAGENKSAPAFGRQTLSMVWDFVEINPFAGAGGDFYGVIDGAVKVLSSMPAQPPGQSQQLDATASINGISSPLLLCTDPPYYDNISYADLSDFFYVWLRQSLGKLYTDLFSTLLVPKAQELVATPYRFGGDAEKAKTFFEEGLRKAFVRMHEIQQPDYPLTIFYAFKQAETDEAEDEDGTDTETITSTGWETMLDGLLQSSFQVTGTWPVRTEGPTRMRSMNSNALASSIVLVCRPRPENAPLAIRREFVAALKRELPNAVKELQHGNIAPVDLAQASIGPGMAVFSRYAKVLEADGTPMRVRTALALINQVLDEVLAEQEGEFDVDTRWAVAWFEQFGFDEGPFGVAETLSKAKNTAIRGMVEADILAAKAGKVRLLRRDELADDWDPTKDRRITVWEVTQHLIRALEQQGEIGAAVLLQKMGELGEVARDLAYRLYGICERKKWAPDALAYNSLVIAWPEIVRLAGQSLPQVQEGLF